MFNIYLPPEIVDIIADFHDYEKYCKPKHYDLLKGIINDIGDMALIMPSGIHPYIAAQCWGNKNPNNLYTRTIRQWVDHSELT